ncbi:MAG: sulfotransferase [Saprospiraceae bacterium]|nr:sulfotransferase [Saprospiraceae bacterium]
MKAILKDVINPKAMTERNHYVFLLSHMRGYTSVLSHIIGSHPNILGYSEMHQSYRSWFSFLKLKYKAKLVAKAQSGPKFLFDKVLHNNYTVAPNILLKPNVHALIMVREPEKTIKSVINMGQKMSTMVAWYRNPEKVTQYYIKRLRRLKKLGQKLEGKALFIDAQDVVDDTPKVLRAIEAHLELDRPLSQEYDTFALTGTFGAGDPSDHIKSGKIVKNRGDYSNIVVPERLLQQAQQAYLETTQALRAINKTV